ncbi:MAG: lytic transglycosylase domain-containing protein [Cyclobacteriaceae bacterium]|nr:lytic transglycosylase domain-containing protein [Cyclobacteriaceae bacterium]
MLRQLKTILVLVIGLLGVSAIGSWYSQNKEDVKEQILEVKPLSDTAKFENARFISLPSKLEFAGEAMPLNDPNVRERMDREIHINTYWHTNTILMIKKANRWLPAIAEELAKAGIPDDFKYLVAIETNFKNDTSPRNAVGFWQFLKASGKEQGLEITAEVDERYDPIKSTQAAAKYLKNAYNKFGSWTLAAASYNRGVAGMKRAMAHQKELNYYNLLLNEETSRYVFRIMAAKLILKSPADYGFTANKNELYQPFETYDIEVTKSISSLVDWAQQNSISYRQLKRYNPWLRTDKLTIAFGKKYVIKLPK